MNSGMKKYGLLFVVMVALVSIVAYIYPETCKLQEGDSFFLFTTDYFLGRLPDVPALNSYFADFLYQFFKWPIAGGLIMAFLYGTTAVINILVLKRLGICSTLASGMVVIAPLIVVACYPFILVLQIDAFFFSLALLLYAISSRWQMRAVLCLLYVPFSLMLLNTTVAFFLFFFLSGIEYFHFHSRFWIPLIGLLIYILGIYLYSQYISFIPFERRLYFVRGVKKGTESIYLLSYFALVLGLIPVADSRKIKYFASCMIVAVIFGLLWFFANEKERHDEERCFGYSSLAEAGKWQELLRAIRSDGGARNVISMRYALLAEVSLGTLTENLFRYDISKPADFHFRRDRQKFACRFNRQFYANLSIYDEAMHHAMEYGLQTDNGTCFSTLRYMTECQIREGDYPVALKYLAVLDKSLFNKAYVRLQRQRIAEFQKSGRGPVSPMRADNFVGGYPFNSEMIRLAYSRKNNKVFIEYVLCGLLLERNINTFATFLRGLNPYKDQPIPRAFAEAASMCKNLGQNLHDVVQYPDEIDQQFLRYQADFDNENFDPSDYEGTYWNYYFYGDEWEAERKAAAEKKSGNAPK